MASTPSTPIAEARPQPRLGPARGFTGTATLLGVLGFVISFTGSWRPSFWGDEAASVMSAERSLPSLFRMLGNVDAVHGSYYLVLHYWVGIFGSSELSARLPSAIAIGVATAGTFVLARSLFSSRLGIIAALVFAVLPRVTYMGVEARSTAMAAAVTVWSTALLVHALRTRSPGVGIRWQPWAGYAVFVAGGIYLFLNFALVLPAHALAVLLLSGTGESRRQALRSWGMSTLAALAIAGPVLFWGFSQRDQISFLVRRPGPDLRSVAVVQWFGNVPFAILAWSLILLGVIAVLAAGRRPARAGCAEFGVSSDIGGIRALAVILAWLLVPTAALVIGAELGAPMYAARYLSSCAPAAAIAIAIGISSLRVRWLQAATIVLAIALAAPSYLGQRGEYAKNRGSDWRQASEVVQAGATPGDAVVFDEGVRPSRKPRLALRLYPVAFGGLQDVTLNRPFYSTDGLWDTTVPLASVADELAGTNRVWLLQYVGTAGSVNGTNVAALRQLGFTVVDSTTIRRTAVIEMTR